MSSRTVKKLLLSLIAIGALATITTGGTYAVLQSETGNINNNVASGTLTMSDAVNGQVTPCTSQASSGTGLTSNFNTAESSPASAGCSVLVDTSTLYYPGTLKTVQVEIKNTGSVPGYKLSLFMPGATGGAGCTSADNPSATVHGGGNACGSTSPAVVGDLFYVEERAGGFAGSATCIYPAHSGACAITDGGTLNDFSNQYYAYVGHSLSLGGGPNAQASRYFIIGIQEGVDNTLQGETAKFSLTWHLDSTT